MKSDKYIKSCLITESGLKENSDEILERLNDRVMARLLHSAIGMATEAGEVLDMLKKHIYYGRELDLVNLEEELGDCNWYQSIMIDAMKERGYHTDWEKIWNKNIAKLKKRYGGKFSPEKAIHRNLDAERDVLKENEQLANELEQEKE